MRKRPSAPQAPDEDPPAPSIFIRAISPALKGRLDQLSRGRGMTYKQYLDRVTRLHVIVRREAAKPGGTLAARWLREAGFPADVESV
jgi:hypothetical protein